MYSQGILICNCQELIYSGRIMILTRTLAGPDLFTRVHDSELCFSSFVELPGYDGTFPFKDLTREGSYKTLCHNISIYFTILPTCCILIYNFSRLSSEKHVSIALINANLRKYVKGPISKILSFFKVITGAPQEKCFRRSSC